VVHSSLEQLITHRGDISNFEAVRDHDKLRQQRHENTDEKGRICSKYVDLYAQSGENGVKASKQRKKQDGGAGRWRMGRKTEGFQTV
jgi:ATP-binding cassette subfamily F protein 3